MSWFRISGPIEGRQQSIEWQAEGRRVVVKPVGRGRRVPASERVDVYVVGSEKQCLIPEPPSVDPELLAALTASASEAA